MNAAIVARALGGQVAGQARVLAPGPGHSAVDRSLAVTLDPAAPDGFRVHSFAGDDWRACRDHVRDRLGLAEWRPDHPFQRVGPGEARVASRTGSRLPERQSDARTGLAGDREGRTLRFAQGLWDEASPVPGTPAGTYLRARGLGVADETIAADALRFHPACPFHLEDRSLVRLPAMLGAMTTVRENRFCGVHRTALNGEGSAKASIPGLGSPKKMLGSAKEACVRLSADEDVTTGLHVAEGIETALACMGMGFSPIWAMLSAGAISTLPVLTGIEALTVFADHDQNGAGLRAARQCARPWAEAGAEVTICTPPEMGSDWADEAVS